MSTGDPDVIAVDDDIDTLYWIDDFLQDHEIADMCYGTAELYLQDAGSPVAPKCMILRVENPGMDGFGLHAQLVSQGINVPTMFITNRTTISIAERVRQIETAGLWETSANPEYLLEFVRQAINAPHDTAPGRPATVPSRERVITLTQ